MAQAQAAWSPTLTSTLQNASTDSPSNSFLSGAETKISDDRLNTNVGVAQTLPWGGRYNVGWDSSRSTTTNIFSNFSPQVRSSLALTYVQPLLRGFSIDTPRQQLLFSQNNREIADVTLRQAIAATSRTVRNAYWDLAFAIASLEVQRQSLELARESLRNTRARIEIGTTPPIDSVEAEAEVAQREEAVILGEGADRHRRRTRCARSSTIRPRPISGRCGSSRRSFRPSRRRRIDVDAATRARARSPDRPPAVTKEHRGHGHQPALLPQPDAARRHGQLRLRTDRAWAERSSCAAPGFPGPIVGQSERGFGTVLGDLFAQRLSELDGVA